MSDNKLKMTSFLVYKRKEVSFDIPDDFPEDQIPNFMTEAEFKKWYKSQKFKNLSFSDLEDEGKASVIEFKENNYNAELNPNDPKVYKLRINTVKSFFKDLKTNRHLLQGSFNVMMIALDPLDYLRTFSSKNLPLDFYKQYKKLLLDKYPQKTLNEILKPKLDKYIINSSSEQFIVFLKKEKIELKKINFFQLDFSRPGKLTDLESLDEFAEPPFSTNKIGFLLRICDTHVLSKDQNKIVNHLLKLIETNQIDKIKLLISKKLLKNDLLKTLLTQKEDMSIQIKSLILESINR